MNLIRRNAVACEKAKGVRCSCHCGGALHGKRHGERWILAVQKQWDEENKFLGLFPEQPPVHAEE